MKAIEFIKSRLNAQTIEVATIQQEDEAVLVIDKCMCDGKYEVCLVYEVDKYDSVGKAVLTWKN